MNFDIETDSKHIWDSPKERPGYIYIIKNSSNHYKIGITKNLESRLRQLKTANSEKLELFSYSSVKNNRFVEQFLHKKFKCYQLEGEWFQLSEADLDYITALFRKIYYRQQSIQHRPSITESTPDPK